MSHSNRRKVISITEFYTRVFSKKPQKGFLKKKKLYS